MSEINLAQTEADALLAMEKHRAEETAYSFPDLGGNLIVPLLSVDRRESFLLDIRRGQIDLAKVKYQTRARRVIVLARLDLAGAPHANPDGQVIPCPHLHLYREDYAHKWAFPVPPDRFTALGDLWQTLEDFMRFCNITKPPCIERSLLT